MFIARSALVWLGCLALSQPVFAQAAPAAEPSAPSTPGRYQVVVVPGHAGTPFLIDTSSGCVWHIFVDEKTKRSTFVEVDVENLHWSWGSGAQQILSSRVDGSSLTDEQKRTLKNDLQKTACGLSHVVLTPGTPAKAGETQQPATAPSPSKPKK